MNNFDKFELFNDENLGKVRTTTDEQGNPWFVGIDVCTILEIINPSSSYALLDKDEKYTLHNTEGIEHLFSPNSRAQSLVLINESGLYTLILRSRKPQAKAFKKWITGTILPSVRKNGGYIVGQEDLPSSDLEYLEKTIQDLSEKVRYQRYRIDDLLEERDDLRFEMEKLHRENAIMSEDMMRIENDGQATFYDSFF